MSGGAIIKYTGPGEGPEQKEVVTDEPEYKPVIIGIYGLPGCGKSYLLKELERELGEESFSFFEGSVFQTFVYLATRHRPSLPPQVDARVKRLFPLALPAWQGTLFIIFCAFFCSIPKLGKRVWR